MDMDKQIGELDPKCRVFSIYGDGNCFFRCISKVVFQTQERYDEIRQLIVNIIEKYPGIFQAYVDGDITNHVRYMRRHNVWATQAEVFACSTLLSRTIYILTPISAKAGKYQWLKISPLSGVWVEDPIGQACFCHINLVNTNGNHYDVIIKNDESCNCNTAPPVLNREEFINDLPHASLQETSQIPKTVERNDKEKIYNDNIPDQTNVDILKTVENVNEDDKKIKKQSMSTSQLEDRLFKAAKEGRLDEVKRCVKQGVDVNCRDERQATPLCWAANNGHRPVCQYLFQQGAELNARDIEGFTALRNASFKGHSTLVSWLLSEGCNVSEADEKGYTPLHVASQNGILVVVKQLTDRGADVNAKNKEGSTPLFLASQDGHLEVAKLLTDRGADVNCICKDEATPLLVASQNGHFEVVKLLTDRGAEVNSTRKDGATPLSLASQNGHMEVVKLLTDRGANVNLEDENGNTPLHSAAYSGETQTCKYLYSKRADIHSRNSDGRTPFHWACQTGHLSVMDWILSLGFDLNETSNIGWTGLHEACNVGELKAVQYLIESKAKVDSKDKNSKTPTQLAEEENHTAVVEYLNSYMKTHPELAVEQSDTVPNQDVPSHYYLSPQGNDNGGAKFSAEKDKSQTSPDNVADYESSETVDSLSSGVAGVDIDDSSHTQTGAQIDDKVIQAQSEATSVEVKPLTLNPGQHPKQSISTGPIATQVLPSTEKVDSDEQDDTDTIDPAHRVEWCDQGLHDHDVKSKIQELDKKTQYVRMLLKRNQLKTVPLLTKSPCFKKLNILSLSENKITELSHMSDLDNLDKLDLTNNKLTSVQGTHLPKNIKVLVISDNNITKLTDMPFLDKLEELYLRNNKLTSIQGTYLPKNIKVLDISNNKVNKIDSLPNTLRDVRLAGNPLEQLEEGCFPSEELYDTVRHGMTKEQEKQLKKPSSDAFEQGYQAVIDELIDDSKKPWTDIRKKDLVQSCLLRILMAGKCMFGKSSLARSLLYNKGYTMAYDDRTVVMDYRSWKVTDLKSIALYDLGGHDCYMQLGHLFHADAKNNFSIIPHDIASDDYPSTCKWITDILSRSPSSSIKLVLTKADSIGKEEIEIYKNKFIKEIGDHLEKQIDYLEHNLERCCSDTAKDRIKSIKTKCKQLKEQLHNRGFIHITSCVDQSGLVELRESIMEDLDSSDCKVSMPEIAHKLYTQIGMLGVKAESMVNIDSDVDETSLKASGNIKIINKETFFEEFSKIQTAKSHDIKEINAQSEERDQSKSNTNQGYGNELSGASMDLNMGPDTTTNFSAKRKLEYHNFDDLVKNYNTIVGHESPLSPTQCEQELRESLQALHVHGLLFWYSESKTLEKFVFNDVSSFVNFLKSLFNHDAKEKFQYRNMEKSLRLYMTENNIMKTNYETYLDQLNNEGLMNEMLLKIFVKKYDFHDKVDILVDLLQHLSIVHKIPTGPDDDHTLFFPWYVETKDEPEVINKSLKRMHTSSGTHLLHDIVLRGFIPTALFHAFCVRMYEHLDPRLSHNKYLWKDNLFASLDGIELHFSRLIRDDEGIKFKEDEIRIRIYSPVDNLHAVKKSCFFVSKVKEIVQKLKDEWWPGMLIDMFLKCQPDVMHDISDSNDCTHKWAMNEKSICKVNSKRFCPTSQHFFPASIIYPVFDIYPVFENDDVAEKCLEELRDYLKQRELLREQQKAEPNKDGESPAKVFPTDIQLHEISNKIGFEMEEMAAYLGLTNPDVEQIKLDHKTAHNQNFNVLLKWRERCQVDARERLEILQICFRSCGREPLVKMLQKMYNECEDSMIQNGGSSKVDADSGKDEHQDSESSTSAAMENISPEEINEKFSQPSSAVSGSKGTGARLKRQIPRTDNTEPSGSKKGRLQTDLTDKRKGKKEQERKGIEKSTDRCAKCGNKYPPCKGKGKKKAKQRNVDWVACDTCSLWLHCACVGVDVNKLGDSYCCPSCTAV